MFYDYVRQHPLVAANWQHVITGDRIQSKNGYLYLILRDKMSDRSFVIRDTAKNTSFTVRGDKLTITRNENTRNSRSKVIVVGSDGLPSLQGEERDDLNELDNLLETIMLEKRQEKSTTHQLLSALRDPIAKLFLLCALLYGILTFITMFGGKLFGG